MDDGGHRPTNQFVEFLWRLAEIYIVKLGLICQIVMSFNICALNLITIILFEVGVCLPVFGPYAMYTSCLFQIFVASTSLFFHFNPIADDVRDEKCISWSSRSSLVYIYEWLGINMGNVQVNVAIICLAACLILLQIIVAIRQRRRGSEELRRSSSLLFPEADSADVLHQGFYLAVKFGCNYWFYKVGLEVTLSILSLNAMVRMDLIGCIYLLMVIPSALLSRSTVKTLWPMFLMIFGILMFLQYAFTVGMPENECYSYPWDRIISIREFNDNLVEFLCLPSVGRHHLFPIFFRMMFDAITMSMMATQVYCFELERTDHPAGDNSPDENYNLVGLACASQEDNFMSYPKSSFDYIKIFVVMALHWITLVSYLSAGLGGRSVFNIGYLVIAFIVLWQGNSIYKVATLKRTIIQWKLMLGFNVMTMFMKISIQILACGYIFTIKSCTLQQWLNVICSSSESIGRINEWRKHEGQEDCRFKKLQNELPVDVLAFTFLMFNLRLLYSKIFKWRILEIYCEEIQANSGAILINQLISKEVHNQYEKQVRTLKQIAKRAAELRKNYEHQNNGQNFRPQTYHQAKHSGDYYMFDYDPQQDDLNEDSDLFINLDGRDSPEDKAKLTPIQIIFALVAQGLDFEESLKAIENAESIHDEELRMLEAVRTQPKESNDPLSSDSMESFKQRRKKLREGYASDHSTKRKKTFKEKIRIMGSFLAKLFSAIVHHLSCFMRKHSKQQRYVTFVLGKEKIKLKKKILDELRETGDIRTLPCNPVMFAVNDVAEVQREAREAENLIPPVCRFLLALYNYITANTDSLCFLLAIITHAYGGGVITMPLPIMVFFWGSLSNPRAEKVFWIFMMIYTQVIIVIKCIAQISKLPSFSFNMFDRKFTELDVQSYLGLQDETTFAMCDVVLLLFLFFHRYMLQRLGLWKYSLSKIGDTSDSIDDEEYNCCIQFFQNVINPKKRFIGDVYSSTFLLDLVCISIVLFGYSSFADTSTDGVLLIHTSRIPLSLDITVIVFIFLVVIDRALYLRKLVLLKLIYHFLVVITLHGWLFFVIPYTTRTNLPENKLAQAFYIIKSINLLLSGWQIKNGYPPLCTGGVLTKNYGFTSFILYSGFMNIPFAFELRSAIDWTWTDTVMPIFDFIKFEIFFSNVYMVKCARQMEQNFPVPRGQKKAMTAKHAVGVPIILLLVIVILSPILLFSLLNMIGQRYPPLKMKIELSFKTLPPFYESVVENFDQLSDNDRNSLAQSYIRLENDEQFDGKKARLALTFLKEFYNQDIYKISFEEYSVSAWDMSPGALHVLYQNLLLGNRSEMNVNIKLERGSNRDTEKPIRVHVMEYKVNLEGHTLEELRNLINQSFVGDVLLNQTMEIPFAIPYYVLVPSSEKIEFAGSMLKVVSNVTESQNQYEDTFSKLKLNIFGGMSNGGFYWKIKLSRSATIANVALPITSSDEDCDMLLFMDRMFPDVLSSLSTGGIIPLYIAVVYVAFKFIRAFIFAEPLQVIIKEMPNPDPLLKILLDLYLVREAQDFLLEEELFAKMIFLFRSPGTLIKWSRFKLKHE